MQSTATNVSKESAGDFHLDFNVAFIGNSALYVWHTGITENNFSKV